MKMRVEYEMNRGDIERIEEKVDLDKDGEYRKFG